MNFTDEQYEYLKNFEPQFNTAIKSHFVRMDNRNTLAEFESIYKSVFGRPSNILGGCMRCVVDALVKLGTLYYKDKEEKTQKTAPIDLIDENCGTTITKTTTKKKKAPTKKKTTKK